jgi:hypothetical protein
MSNREYAVHSILCKELLQAGQSIRTAAGVGFGL